MLIKELVYERLLVPDDTGELSPWLARSWQLLPNGNLYVEPDPNRTFSDGSPVTLQDVADSLVAFGLNPAPLGSGLEIAPGSGRLRPELVIPRAPIFKMVPGGYLGTGPFAIVTQNPDRIVLQRTFRVPHRIDRVELIGYANYRDLVAALLKGDCNGAVIINPDLVEILDGLHRFQILPIYPAHQQAIFFNRHVLSPKERSVLLPYLRDSNLEYVVSGGPRRSTSDPGLLTLDPGPRITLVTWDNDKTSYRLALAVRRLLGRRGGEILNLSTPEALAAIREGQFGIMVTPVLTWPEAEGLALWRSDGPLSSTGYSNPALDAALETGDWKAARRAFDLDPPGLFLMEWPIFAAFDQRILNPTLGRYLQFGTLSSWVVP